MFLQAFPGFGSAARACHANRQAIPQYRTATSKLKTFFLLVTSTFLTQQTDDALLQGVAEWLIIIIIISVAR